MGCRRGQLLPDVFCQSVSAAGERQRWFCRRKSIFSLSTWSISAQKRATNITVFLKPGKHCPRFGFPEIRGKNNTRFYECRLEIQCGFHNHYIILICKTDIQEMSRVKRKEKSQISFLEQCPHNSKYPALWIIQWNICCSWARPFLGTVSFFFFLLQFWLYWVQGLHCCMRAFYNCSDPGYSLVAEYGLLAAVASFVEHGL